MENFFSNGNIINMISQRKKLLYLLTRSKFTIYFDATCSMDPLQQIFRRQKDKLMYGDRLIRIFSKLCWL